MSNETDNKIKIIDEIIKRHPSYGVKRGWSDYVGGMKDSGEWYFRKMLDESEYELRTFLNYLISQENQPPRQYTEEEIKDMNTWYKTETGVINEYTLKAYKKFGKNILSEMLFGEKNNHI